MENKEKKHRIVKIILIFLLIGSAYFFAEKYLNYEGKTKKISLGKCQFKVEIPKSLEERAGGLGGRDSLCDKCGMLFVFAEKGNYKFWMKNMNFPLDFVWIADNKVVSVSENIAADYFGTIDSDARVNKILEINSGEVKRCEIEIGSEIK